MTTVLTLHGAQLPLAVSIAWWRVSKKTRVADMMECGSRTACLQLDGDHGLQRGDAQIQQHGMRR